MQIKGQERRDRKRNENGREGKGGLVGERRIEEEEESKRNGEGGRTDGKPKRMDAREDKTEMRTGGSGANEGEPLPRCRRPAASRAAQA